MDKTEDELSRFTEIFHGLSQSERQELNIFTPNDFITWPPRFSIKQDIDGSVNNFVSIEIKHKSSSTSVKLDPIKYYICDTPDEKEHRFVLYEISQNIDSELTSTKTHILYYISDGRTNNLRANVLYPFWCLNDVSGYGEDCPRASTSILSEWGLFKIQLFNNMNLDIIDKKIFDTTVDELREVILNTTIKHFHIFFPGLSGAELCVPLKNLLETQPKIVDDIVKKITIEELIKLHRHGGQLERVISIDSNNPSIYYIRVGLRSVLKRVNNTLDFLIAFINVNITDFNESNIDKYRPAYINKSKYNMSYSGTNDNHASVTRPIINMYETNYNIVEHFRKNLLKEIKKLIENILNLDIIEHKKKILNPITIDSKSFNKAFKVCTGSDGQFIDSFEERMSKFEKISHSISDIFLSTISSKPTNSDTETLKSIFKEFMTQKNSGLSYAELIYKFAWNAKCNQKYLKYKTKYLQLKNKSV